ncbi:MAG: prepilin-type N-terminal cleavage/methylation domain-containing protein [Planctomycetes bacterium]|nr:prepilin-type N-terminal cleavage/methylation domain-containing protein [Planctomycetota bacterium]
MARANKGFTLIELIVVMVILGIAAAVAFPRLDAFAARRTALAAGANKVAALAMHARSGAVSSGTMRLLCIDTKTGRYWVCPRAPGRDETPSEADSEMQGRLPDGVAFETVEVTGAAPSDAQRVAVVRFSAEGWSDQAVIRLSGPEGKVKSIVVRPLYAGVEIHDSRIGPLQTPIDSQGGT